MGFYGNITNTSRTQFQFDLVYPSRNAMENGCAKDGVYVGRYVLVDYDRDPNNQFKIGYRKGKLIDFKDDEDFLYSSKNLEEISKINYIEDEYWDYENNTTDIIKGVTKGIVVKVKETETQYKEYDEDGKPVSTKDEDVLIEAGEYSLFICTGKVTVEEEQLDGTGEPVIVIKNYALFKKQLEDKSESNYIVNYNKDKDYYKIENIGRGWDSTVWQKVYENGLEKYVIIAELNSVVPTFDIQADAPSMSPITPHFDENSTNVYYKLHWQPQWGMRTRAAAGDLQTSQINRNGEALDKTYNPDIYTSSSVDLGKSPAETYPSDADTKWEKYEYNPSTGLQEKYVYTIKDNIGEWKKSVDVAGEEEAKIPAAIYWNEAGFDSKVISDTTLHPDEVLNAEWDGKTDFISIKPTGWSGHQYSPHDGTEIMKPAPDTQEMMVMLPSIGNTISKVWDVMYGDEQINNSKFRNKNIDWVDPSIGEVDRKGLRLIGDKYLEVSLTPDQYKKNFYYKYNEETQTYEILEQDNFENIQGVDKYYVRTTQLDYNPDQVGTVAGAINSIHDLMGMIIVDRKGADPEEDNPEDLALDRIYYYPIDGTYRIKDFQFKYNEIINFEYVLFDGVTGKGRVTEKEFVPDILYKATLDGEGNIIDKIQLTKDAKYSDYEEVENEVYGEDNYIEAFCVKKLPKGIENSLFEIIHLDIFKSGWYKTSDGSYLYKKGGTPDDGITYYEVLSEKLETARSFDDDYVENKFYAKYPGEQKEKYYLINNALLESDKWFRYNDLNLIKPFYFVPQNIEARIYPYVNSIDNINYYDFDKLKENKEPYLPNEGYWDGTELIKDKEIYPVYFFSTGLMNTYGPYYIQDTEGNGNVGKWKVLATVPKDGFAYILDRPRTNANMPMENPTYGSPANAYKVKLINYDTLNNDIKEHLYFPEIEEYYEDIMNEEGQIESVKKTRFISWERVTADHINSWYRNLGLREGLEKELDVLKPAHPIYYIDFEEPIRNLYEANKYFYRSEHQDDPSIVDYIKDKNSKFDRNENRLYYIKDNFDPTSSLTALKSLGQYGHYYAPNKYYYLEDGQYIIDKSLYPKTKVENGEEVLAVDYFKRRDIYISEDTSGLLQKGSSWNMNAEAIPHSVTLGEREEVEYMKELKGFGRNTNTLNGLIVDLNRLMATDKPDTRDRSTVQGAINYLNDTAIKIHTLTPGEFPVIDHYGRLNSGEMDLDDWIDVKFDPNVDEPRMIIRHIFNPDDIENTQRDLNIVEEGQEVDDTITFPTYKFDDMGHQVNTKPTLHTITLPYGFKTIKAINTEDDAVNGPAIEINEGGQIADNTQDTLTFSASNRWIKFDNNTEDTVKVGHLLSPFIDETVPNKLYGLTQNEDHTKVINDKGDLDKDNTFEVPCFQFDEAGHILEARTHTVTLPEIYNKFIVSAETAEVANMDYVAGTITADNMNDTVTFTPGNKWIHMAVSGTNDENTLDTDVIKIAHEVTAFDDGEANKEYGLLADETISDANNSFEIPAFKFDEAGHIRGARTHTLTLPFGFTKFTKSAHVTTEDADKTEGGGQIVIEPDTMTDNLSFGNGNKWICIDGNAENDTFTFSHYVKDFVEGASTTDLNDNGTFTVQELSWDRAGHLTASNKRTYTLPYNFKTVSVTGTSSVTENSLNGTDDTIIADTQVDTLTLLPGNKWIQLIGNAENDSVTFKHYVNKFIETTATTDNNTLANNTISTQELTWDEAGHLIGSNKRTYTLPYNFKTFTILNEGNGVTETGVATNGKLIAEDQIDEMTLTSGNRWITMIADTSGRKATIAHAVAGTASVSKGDTANQTPAFGSTFKVLSAGIDQTGHVSSLEEHTVQIPLASLNNETVGGVDSVLTKLSLEPTTGAFTTEHKNVGELLITGYSVATENSAVSATDSINSAFGKVQKALDTLNANSETAGSVAKSVKDLKDELQDNCSERFNTLAKIESDINDGSETTLVERVQDLEKRALPHYNELEDEGVYLMKMIDGQPNWIKLATWTGGTY